MFDHHIHSNSKRSWLLNWFSHWVSPHPHPHPSSPLPPPPQQQRQQPPVTIVTDNSDRRSDISTSTEYPSASIATSAGRRSSYQSSVMDDDDDDVEDDGQLSYTSKRRQQQQQQRRDSNERSVLSDLWSRARRHHPHYPQFQWMPGSSSSKNHRHPHRMSADDSHQHLQRRRRQDQQQIFAHSVSGTPRQSQEAIHLMIAQPDTDSEPASTTRRLATSFQENALYIPTDDSPLSRPVSIYSQRTSILDDDDDDYNEWSALDSIPSSAEPPWAIKPELVRLVMENSPFNDTAAGKQVLHVGPGDGTWAVDVAMDYPRWRVVDLITLDSGQPSAKLRYYRRHHRNLKAARCASLVEGIQLLPDASFDLIHCRFLNLVLTRGAYQEFLHHLWRVCRPGGFVEFLELDMRIYFDRPTPSGVGMTQKLNSGAIAALERKDLDPRVARRLKDLLLDLGKTSPGYQALLDHKYASLPLGTWGGRIGVMFRDDIRDLFERLQESESDDDANFEAQFDQMDYELGARRAFMNLHFAYAQKVERPEH
ncbi:hypothetical protein BX666DRAFT_2032632 [Dichotomocladium elegans]|nr:hypothetical protein BX666DRAFT_2032632 [Dichotomocladium elegans]